MKQAYFSGTEPPDVVQVVAIDDAIDSWNDAQRDRKNAAEAVRIKHATILELLKEYKLEVYPYTDPKNGKKRQIRIKTEPKVVSELQAAKPQSEDVEVRDADDWTEQSAPIGMGEAPVDNVIEMRKVKRTAEHDAVVDPFASTRAAMDETASQDAAVETPKKGKGKAKR